MPSREKIVTSSATRTEILNAISKNDHLPAPLREEMADIILAKVKQILGALPRAPAVIIWGGGFPRGEATYIKGTLLNDIDLFVFSFSPFLPRLKKLEEWKNLKDGNKVKISISVGAPYHLIKHKTLANYELKTGAVIYGDRELQKKISANPNNLSKFGGLRRLMTRLAALQDLKRPPLELDYLAAKTYIACADSYLILGKDMSDALKIKVKTARQLKASKIEEAGFSLGDAKKELLTAIGNYDLDALQKNFPRHIMLNLFFYLRLRKKFSPVFFNIVFNFSIINLYKALLRYDKVEQEGTKKELKRFIRGVNRENFLEIYSLYPNIASMQLL